jgi:Flp pilus assembly pilin Flp
VTGETPRRGWRAFLEDSRGAVFAEYVVILVLVVVASVVVWKELHEGIEDDASAEYTTFGYPPDD